MSPANGRESSSPGNAYSRIQSRVEFGDALLFLFILVLVRQYLWFASNNAVAWTISATLALAAWYFFIATKEFAAEKFGRSFWLVVALPLLAIYSLRAAFPDHSFDVFSYHLLNAERTLRGPLFAPGDFFPTAVPFNPAPDTLTGISRMILGFRLGTAINLLVLIWAGQILDKILRPFVAGVWSRAVCVLFIVLAENLLFEISTYMIDLLALPLLLEATRLTLSADKAKNPQANYVHIAVLLGAATAFKISNLAVVLPLVAICAFKAIKSEHKQRHLIKTAVVCLGAFVAPLAPFALYMFRVTGNPLFPIANAFFKSPYWPTHGGWDNRWGPHSFWETILWPVLIYFKPERHSELAVYSGRLSLGFVVALVALLIAWRCAGVWKICFILVVSSLLWSVAGLGYSRYGLYQEVFAGVAIVVVAATLWQRIPSKLFVSRVATVGLGVALTVQTTLGFSYFLNKEWGSRTTLIEDPDNYAREMKLMLRDRSLPDFLNDSERASLGKVQLWLETCPQSTGFEALINPRAPIIAVRQPEYFFTRESWRQFIRAVDSSDTQGMYSLCLNDDVSQAKQVITERGLEVSELTPIELPFFSRWDRIGMMLIQVRRPLEAEARSQFEAGWMKGAFPSSDYREEIVAIDPPSIMRPGEKVDIRFRVKNLGHSIWPAVGTKDFRYQINMGDRWMASGTRIEDNRAVMTADLAPGSETEMKLTVNAPFKPGDYTLEIDMVHEGVTWFSERGAHPLHLNLRVAP